MSQPDLATLTATLGGVGLFLFGMAVMTSGLRKLAGDRLRDWLARSTRTPFSGAVTGATVTALVQSSSATTLAAMGFVGAGLMSFNASLGIIFGANIGTTATGWMVALLGFKLRLTEAAFPLVFVAAVCYLLKSVRRVRGFGKALAGFCLLFIGISYLQIGLEGYRDQVDLSEWNAASFGGRVVLVLIGVLITLITQSSSATVAMAVTALSASVLDLTQAAAVIIGADIGTTGTAALATIGGTTAARRTGFAHVSYNLMTGIGAFFLLPVYLWLVEFVWPGAAENSAEVVAVGFHSTFNTLGVIAVLPFTAIFGRFVERLFPERVSPLSAPFDRKLLEDYRAAVVALETGSERLAAEALSRSADVLAQRAPSIAGASAEIFAAIDVGRDFAVQVGARDVGETTLDSAQVFHCIHLIDHIERLVERAGDETSARFVGRNAELGERAGAAADLLRRLSDQIRERKECAETRDALTLAATDMEEDKPRFRERAIRSAATEGGSGDELNEYLDAHRWLRRLTYHAARIAHYHCRLRGE